MINLTKYALRKPITIILCLLTIAYFGITSLMGTKIELQPEMKLPLLVVSTPYPGAASGDVNDLVIRKQEDAISSLDGVKSVNTTAQENAGIIIIQYQFGTNMDTAYINLKKAIDGVKGQLPEKTRESSILALDFNAEPVVTLAISGNAQGNLYTYVEKKLVPEFQKLSAVGEVSISGGQKAYTRIEVKPEKMEQYHLDMSFLAQLVGSADFSAPAGSVEVGNRDFSVSAANDYKNTESLKSIVIPLPSGETIHLSDVATVYEALEDPNSIGRYNGENVISVEIKKVQNATAIDVSNQVMAQIEMMKTGMPGIQIDIVNDSSIIILDALNDVITTLVIAIILSMLILWLFYGDIKASVIVGTSIPISVVLALIAMSAMDFSLNQISMISLVLGVGMMVDNSINILDGCFRAREKLDFYEAAVEGSRTMLGSIIGGTATTCVVFLPLALLDGISGQMFKQLGFIIVFCLVASLFSAVIIVPLCYLKWQPVEKAKAPANGMIKFLQAGYRKYMPSIITRKKMVFGLSLGLLAFSFFVASKLNVNMMASIDEGIVDMTVKVKPGLKVDAVNQVVKGLEDMVMSEEDVDHYLLTFGSSGLNTYGGIGEVKIRAYLKEEGGLSTDEMVNKWRKDTQYYKNCSIKIEQGSTMGGVSSEDEITVNLQGTDYDVLKAAAKELTAGLRGRTDVMQVHSSVENAVSIIKVDIDPIKAQTEKMTSSQIGAEIYNNLSGIKATTIRMNGDEADVIVEYDPEQYNTVDKLQGMRIRTASGASLPLEDLGEIRYEDSPAQIERNNKQYQVAITMSPQAGAERTAKKSISQFVSEWKLPPGVYPAASSGDQDMMEEMSALGRALITGVFLVFIVMAIQFQAPKYSLMVMSTIPFALIGSFGLLFLADSPISMTSMVGFLMLVGTVVNNGILYVETVQQLLEEMPLLDALVEAGAIRMRPIFMTTLTTVIAMMPSALAFGKSGKMMQDLSLVNVGGILASTALTLVLLPTYYLVVHNMKKKNWGKGMAGSVCPEI
ncbi:AcrB/AcrD/AcrF family protein [Clostridium sp. MCC353]|uniref:efflux RND transporter permease subunit n=1 Tax=Clostridium sp. MCC353 TaxID=2592646 RepID=UPI001C02E5A6|nr:efflux RND transporter permease subunit [Clostridium sp. MCC353]MBT9778888.1 AcrB/AcrD/AcrF family protein [Clostridium sp. MCC353]